MLEPKIIKRHLRLQRIVSGLRLKGKKIIFTNGCFDILHYGHVKYLEDAKKKGDVLIVAINSDASIKSIKGNKRPITQEGDRLRIIAGLQSVDYVTIFDDDTPIKLIKLLKPDILVKGSDWKKNKIVGSEFVLKQGGKIYSINLIPGRSTTSLINKLAKSF